MSLREYARLYNIIGFCRKIFFKYGWFLIKYQFLDSICFIFSYAGLNSVTKGSIFSSFLGFVFNAALLLSNLTSARVFSIRVFVPPRSKRRFLKFSIWFRNLLSFQLSVEA